MSAEIFDAPPFTRLKQLKHLLATGQINSELFWRSPAFAQPNAPVKAAG
jgi:hypothetical protein